MDSSDKYNKAFESMKSTRELYKMIIKQISNPKTDKTLIPHLVSLLESISDYLHKKEKIESNDDCYSSDESSVSSE